MSFILPLGELASTIADRERLAVPSRRLARRIQTTIFSKQAQKVIPGTRRPGALFREFRREITPLAKESPPSYFKFVQFVRRRGIHPRRGEKSRGDIVIVAHQFFVL